jgi:hypothetical protein
VHNPLVGFVVGIDEELVPSAWQAFPIDGKPVVLSSDETTTRVQMERRQIVATIAKSTIYTIINFIVFSHLSSLHFESVGTGSACQQLMAQANSENWLCTFRQQRGQSLYQRAAF